MQRGASADQINDTNQRATTGRAFDIHDFILIADAEIDGFADPVVQILHEGAGHGADADARLDDVAQFKKTDSQRIGAVLVSLDEACVGHDGENAVRR